MSLVPNRFRDGVRPKIPPPLPQLPNIKAHWLSLVCPSKNHVKSYQGVTTYYNSARVTLTTQQRRCVAIHVSVKQVVLRTAQPYIVQTGEALGYNQKIGATEIIICSKP